MASNEQAVSVFHLEMNAANEHLRTALPDELSIAEAEIKQGEFNRFMYGFVGADWEWNERLSWSPAQWQAYAESEKLRTWVATSRGSIAGYYELQSQPESTVELKYFGLVPHSIGKGFGRAMLSHAIDSAWQWGKTERVWVHTCTLDHPSALSNYKARGFTLFKEEIVVD